MRELANIMREIGSLRRIYGKVLLYTIFASNFIRTNFIDPDFASNFMREYSNSRRKNDANA